MATDYRGFTGGKLEDSSPVLGLYVDDETPLHFHAARELLIVHIALLNKSFLCGHYSEAELFGDHVECCCIECWRKKNEETLLSVEHEPTADAANQAFPAWVLESTPDMRFHAFHGPLLQIPATPRYVQLAPLHHAAVVTAESSEIAYEM